MTILKRVLMNAAQHCLIMSVHVLLQRWFQSVKSDHALQIQPSAFYKTTVNKFNPTIITSFTEHI